MKPERCTAGGCHADPCFTDRAGDGWCVEHMPPPYLWKIERPSYRGAYRWDGQRYVQEMRR